MSIGWAPLADPATDCKPGTFTVTVEVVGPLTSLYIEQSCWPEHLAASNEIVERAGQGLNYGMAAGDGFLRFDLENASALYGVAKCGGEHDQHFDLIRGEVRPHARP